MNNTNISKGLDAKDILSCMLDIINYCRHHHCDNCLLKIDNACVIYPLIKEDIGNSIDQPSVHKLIKRKNYLVENHMDIEGYPWDRKES